MLTAIIMTLLVIASVVFHFLNPWQQTDLASNWGSMDQILSITFLVCGLFFVAIMFFLICCLVRYRHREGHASDYGSHNKKLGNFSWETQFDDIFFPFLLKCLHIVLFQHVFQGLIAARIIAHIFAELVIITHQKPFFL